MVLANCQYLRALLIWVIVGQELTLFAVGVDVSCMYSLSLLSYLFPLSLSLGEVMIQTELLIENNEPTNATLRVNNSSLWTKCTSSVCGQKYTDLPSSR